MDATQAAIVASLRASGCSVQSLATVGNGCPDLLVAAKGKLFLLEVKVLGKELRQSQIDWARAWRGPEVYVVTDSLQALSACGLVRRDARGNY